MSSEDNAIVSEVQGAKRSKELAVIYSDYGEQAQQVRRDFLAKLPRGVPYFDPELIVHPLLSSTQYAEIGSSGEALTEVNEIHLGLHMGDIFSLSGVDARVKHMSPDTPEYSQAKALQKQTIHKYITSARRFTLLHGHEYDLSTVEDCVVLCEAMIRENMCDYWGVFPVNMPPRSMVPFLKEVLVPLSMGDQLVMQEIKNRLEDVYAHEYGHFLSGFVFRNEGYLRNNENESVNHAYHDVFVRHGIGARARQIHSLKNPAQKIQAESLELNHLLVESIAEQLPRGIRNRYVRYARRRALDESIARVFAGLMTGRSDYFDTSILHYAVNPHIYLYKGDKGIDEMSEELQHIGLEHIEEYMQKKLNELEGNKF